MSRYDFRQLLKTALFQTSCRANLCDSLQLTVHIKMSVYYYLLILRL